VISGEHWFSRPSEHVSPRRDQQMLAQAASCGHSGDPRPFWASKRLA